MFYVGQKVVCLDNTVRNRRLIGRKLNVPEVGGAYTIREICQTQSGFGFRFEEIRNDVSGMLEPCFSSRRFRPVVNTDISIFTAMLKPTRQGADA